jgi:signal transduction histidine kinase
MTVLNTDMHAVTFVITVFELVMLFFAIIWLLSRPGDVRRRRYVVLLTLLIFYNIFSGLFPDEKLPIPVALQLVLAYLGGFSVSMYFVYYIYKTFELESLKTISVYGTIGFLFLPFILFFVLPYMITGNAELSRQLVVILPFGFSVVYLYTLTKALWKRYITLTNSIEKEAIIGVFISVLLWATLPIIVFMNGSQVIENGTTNTGFMIMSVLYIRSAIFRSREDYQKILNSEEALREANENLQQKVNERTRELEIANDEKLKAYLNLVHETKTPLTLINNYLDKLFQKFGDSEELHITKINMEKLTRDMEHFFDIQKAANGGLIFHHNQIINWSADLETMLPIYRNWAEEMEITFTDQIESGLCIKSDPVAINRIVGNLVSNAIKFTEPGGFVKVALNGDGQEIQLSVKDSGTGISEARQAHLYEPYYQLSRDKSNAQGLGLGLSIVKITVDSLNGSIDMMSKPGLGTSFTVRLPRYAMANDEIPADNTIQNNLPVGMQRDIELPETVFDALKPVILIVEDNLDITENVV